MGYSCRHYELPDGFETLDAIIELLPEELAFEVVLTPIEQAASSFILMAEAFNERAARRLGEALLMILPTDARHNYSGRRAFE